MAIFGDVFASRQGKKRNIEEEKEEEEETTGQKYNVRICYAGRPQQKH